MPNEGEPRPPDHERTTAVGFSPRRVAVGGRSRATVVATIAGALVAVAVLKPWAASAPAGMEIARSPSPTGSPAIAAATLSPIDARRLPRPEALERAIEPHIVWGVRLVVDAEEDGQLLELWQPTAPAPAGSIPSLSGDVGSLPTFAVAAGRVRFVGFTAPPDAVVDAISFVVGRPLGRAATLQVTTVSHRDGGARSVLLRPRDGSQWLPGVYQFRFKLDGASAAVTFTTFELLPGEPG